MSFVSYPHNKCSPLTKKSRKNTSVTRRADDIEALRELIDEAYRNHLARQKFDEARDSVAAEFGISPDRVKRYLSREVYSVERSEAERIRSAMLTHLQINAKWWSIRASHALRRMRAYSDEVAVRGAGLTALPEDEP